MSKVRVLTPVVDEKDNMAGAKALNVEGLSASKVRVGLLDNTKPNTGRLLAFIGENLAHAGLAAAAIACDKTDSPASNPASHGATEAVLSKLTKEADFVLTGLGN